MFAKGSGAEKLVLIGLQDGPMDTLFRARARLAMLTATSRTTAVFRDLDPQAQYTFLDLLKLLGYTQITLSDGRTWAHRLDIHSGAPCRNRPGAPRRLSDGDAPMAGDGRPPRAAVDDEVVALRFARHRLPHSPPPPPLPVRTLQPP